jgi:hypothetical protein
MPPNAAAKTTPHKPDNLPRRPSKDIALVGNDYTAGA